MFQFLHPRPVVDRRPVAEHSIQVRAVALPVLKALAPAAPAQAAPSGVPRDLSPPAAPSARGRASGR